MNHTTKLHVSNKVTKGQYGVLKSKFCKVNIILFNRQEDGIFLVIKQKGICTGLCFKNCNIYTSVVILIN